jgi:oligopeptide/dipeptide ABC transporter ATP-binding protein
MTGSQPTFEIRNVSKSFPIRAGTLRRITAWLTAVDQVSLSIPRNCIVGLVGESGSGKTTLGRLLVKLLEPTSGEICFEGKAIAGLKGGARRWFRKNVQMLFQDPFLSLNPYRTVFQTLAYPLRVHRLADRSALGREVDQLLDQVGLEAAVANAYPHELSGGQRQRVSLAAALSVQPRFIFCDEPVSTLDMSARAQVLNLLREVQKKRQLTLLIVSHDLSAIDYVCDEASVMYLGGIVERANKESLFAKPRHPYTEALMSAVPDPDLDRQAQRQEIILEGEIPSPAKPPSGCKFHTRCPKRIGAICATTPPLLRRVSVVHEVSCHLFADISQPAALPVDHRGRGMQAPAVMRASDKYFSGGRSSQ